MLKARLYQGEPCGYISVCSAYLFSPILLTQLLDEILTVFRQFVVVQFHWVPIFLCLFVLTVEFRGISADLYFVYSTGGIVYFSYF